MSIRFPVKLGSRQANSEVINFIRTYCPWAVEWRFWWRQIVRVGDYVGEADTDQTLTLNTLYPNNAFPENVDILPGSKARLITPFSGGTITDFDIEMGDAGDPNGLLTISDVFGEQPGYYNTPAAAEYARHYESAFSPTLRLLPTGGNNSAATAGAVELFIPWTPLRSLS